MNATLKTIDDVCEFIGGSQPPKSDFVSTPREGYVRLIQTRDYKTDEFLTYIPANSTTKFCAGSDILIGRYGPPIFQIGRGLEGAYNVALIKARPRENIRNEYLYYFLKQRSICEYVDRLSLRTGGQTGVDLDCLRQHPILLPQKTYQQKVERVLTALDAKIELNKGINNELQHITKLLYDYWFVQFDFPISAAQAAAMGAPFLEGNPYRSSGGKMVYNETLKREIPEKWDTASVSDILKKENGAKKVPNSEMLSRGKIPVIDQGSEFISGFTSDSDCLISETPKIVFGDHTRILKFINFEFARGADGTALISSRDARLPEHLLYHQLLKFDLSNYGYARHFKFLKEQKLVLPPSELACIFEDFARVLFMKIKTNIFQNQELAKVRDWLLPMLMNGQVQVR